MRDTMFAMPDAVNPAMGNGLIRMMFDRLRRSGPYQMQWRPFGRHLRTPLPLPSSDASRWNVARIIPESLLAIEN